MAIVESVIKLFTANPALLPPPTPPLQPALGLGTWYMRSICLLVTVQSTLRNKCYSLLLKVYVLSLQGEAGAELESLVRGDVIFLIY